MATGDTDGAVSEGTQTSQVEGSNQGTGQQGSEQEYVTVAQYNQMMKELQTLQRTLQGDKDRAVKRTNERLDGVEQSLTAVLQKASQDGKSISDLLDDAKRQEEEDFRRTIKEVAAKLNASPATPTLGSEKGNGVDVSEVLTSLELSLDDPRVKEFAGKKFDSKEAALIAGAKLIKTITSKQPTDADAPSGLSERNQNAGKQEQLLSEYNEGSKNLTGQALINFKMKMRQKGLKIY